MLNIYHSNKIEVLAKQLAALCQFDPLSPLAAENIVVESSAMQHWLTDALSKELGIIANVEFPFPAAIIWNIYRLQMPELARHSSFDRAPLCWRLYALFSQNEFYKLHPEFENSSLHYYLKSLNDELQLLNFCQHVAGLYDQYQIYRPDWLLLWREGSQQFADSGQWQAQLWTLLCQLDVEQEDRASIFQRSISHFPLKPRDAKQIAQRLNIFAVSTLAKNYVDLFAELSASIDVNVFVLNPCSVYWGDIQSQKLQLKHSPDGHVDGENNNELLALLARQSRDFVDLLQNIESAQVQTLFIDDAQDDASLLQRIQSDILHLRQASQLEEKDKPLISLDDESICFHSCHSPLREVQLLHDQLLHYLAKKPHIALDEIAIMVPDLERYAPFFHGVFSTTSADNYLAYHIGERLVSEQSGIKVSLLQLLNLSKGAFKRDEVVSLLREPSIAAQFELHDSAMIESLLQALQLRFGLNDEHWYEIGRSNGATGSMVSVAWQQAKQRLLASFAMRQADDWFLSQTLCGIDDDAAEQAGRLCQFIESLMQLNLGAEKTVTQWCAFIEALLLQFFKASLESELIECREIRSALQALLEQSELAKFEQRISADIFISQLEQALQSAGANHYFKPGCINIATLLPLRSMPFKRICVLGLNDGDFPRPSSSDQMDLMVITPRKGDRNRRDEDRYLFLEALLASRDSCYFSFIGRSQVDNSTRYPSLLLTELIKHITRHYRLENRQELITQHALQAFDQRYFDATQPQYFSFNRQALQQSKALSNQSSTSLSFIGETAINLPDMNEKRWGLAQVLAAFKDPSAYFMSELGLRQSFQDLEIEALENFRADGLDNYTVLQRLFEDVQNVDDCADLYIDKQALCRQGLIAQSSVGELEYQALLASAFNIKNQCQQHHLKPMTQRRSFSISLSTASTCHTIEGEISRLNNDFNQRIAWFGRKIHGAHIIKCWLEHLITQIAIGPVNSYLITETAVFKIEKLSIQCAEALLRALLEFIECSAQGL
ncbi:MAG: exodeoxyribonuclease V subunit gamma, partial [Pseudomonadales bacterium]|nr:exodeoxyribonuclease V subunit gamma [Pseudomonadales bacterium]